MALIKGTVKIAASEVEYVYSEDPDVTAPLGCFGWVPAAECVVRQGADRVTQRVMGDEEHARARDAHTAIGLASSRLYINRVTVTKFTGPKVTAEKLDTQGAVGALMRDDVMAFDLLAELGMSRANGHAPTRYYEFARTELGKPAPQAPEGVTDGATKSGPVG